MRLRRVAALTLLCIASSAIGQATDFALTEGGSSGQTLALANTRADAVKHAITIEPKKAEEPPAEEQADSQKTKTKPKPAPLDLTKVKVEVLNNALQHANGFDYTATFTPDAPTQDKKIRGTIEASLPIIGAYTGTLIIKMTDGTVLDRIAITVTREAAEVPLTVGALHALVQEPGSFTFTTTLRSTAARSLYLNAPTITATRTIDEVVTDAKDVKVTIVDANGKGFPAMNVPARTVPVLLRVDGLVEPAKYDATLSFHARGFEPVTKTLAIYIRKPWTVAAVFIFLGVAVSFLLRYYWIERRPRLVVERRYHVLQAKIRQVARDITDDKEAVNLLTILSTFLDDRFTELALQSKWDEEKPFEAMEAKIAVARSWVTARHAARAARPESLRDSLLKKLDEIANALKTSSATAEDMKPHEETLAKFAATMRDAKTATDNIGNAREIADEFAAVRDADKFKDLTAEAEKELRNGDIEKALEASKALPKNLGEIIANEIEKDSGEAESETANRLRNVTSLEQFNDELKKYLEKRLTAVPDEKQEEIKGQIAAGDLAGAWGAILNATKGSAPAFTTTAPASPFTPSEVSSEGFIKPSTEDLKDAQSSLFWGDFWASVAILIIATILGVKVLWSPDLDWGSWTDLAVGFVWGLGLHSFSYDGVSGLITKFKG